MKLKMLMLPPQGDIIAKAIAWLKARRAEGYVNETYYTKEAFYSDEELEQGICKGLAILWELSIAVQELKKHREFPATKPNAILFNFEIFNDWMTALLSWDFRVKNPENDKRIEQLLETIIWLTPHNNPLKIQNVNNFDLVDNANFILGHELQLEKPEFEVRGYANKKEIEDFLEWLIPYSPNKLIYIHFAQHIGSLYYTSPQGPYYLFDPNLGVKKFKYLTELLPFVSGLNRRYEELAVKKYNEGLKREEKFKSLPTPTVYTFACSVVDFKNNPKANYNVKEGKFPFPILPYVKPETLAKPEHAAEAKKLKGFLSRSGLTSGFQLGFHLTNDEVFKVWVQELNLNSSELKQIGKMIQDAYHDNYDAKLAILLEKLTTAPVHHLEIREAIFIVNVLVELLKEEKLREDLFPYFRDILNMPGNESLLIPFIGAIDPADESKEQKRFQTRVEHILDPSAVKQAMRFQYHWLIEANASPPVLASSSIPDEINLLDKNGKRILDLAILRNSIEWVVWALQQNANPTLICNDENFPIHHALLNQCDSRIIQILLQFHTPLNVTNARGNTPLHIAVQGNVANFNLVVQCGVDVNAVNAKGSTPLHVVFKAKHVQKQDKIHYIKTLVAKGADVERLDNEGKTPLMLALDTGDHDLITALLSNAKNINQLRLDGQPVLHYCLLHGFSLQHIQELVRVGALPTTPNALGNTALHVAVQSNIEIFRFIAQQPQNVDQKNNKGNTPLHIVLNPKVVIVDRLPYIEILMARNAKTDLANNEGQTALNAAYLLKNAAILARLTPPVAMGVDDEPVKLVAPSALPSVQPQTKTLLTEAYSDDFFNDRAKLFLPVVQTKIFELHRFLKLMKDNINNMQASSRKDDLNIYHQKLQNGFFVLIENSLKSGPSPATLGKSELIDFSDICYKSMSEHKVALAEHRTHWFVRGLVKILDGLGILFFGASIIAKRFYSEATTGKAHFFNLKTRTQEISENLTEAVNKLKN